MKKLYIVLSVLLACLLSASVQRNAELETKAAGKSVAVTVPPPPAQRADKYGIYNWAINYGAYPGDANGAQDRLNWGADLIGTFATRTTWIFLGARDLYYVNPPETPEQPFELARAAASPAYDKLFRDPRFKTIMITAYSAGAMRDNWADGFTEAEYQAERAEIRRLGEYLISNPNYAGKTFMIFSWEGDNAINPVASKQSSWDYYVRWLQARVDGINDARATHPTQAQRLFSGLEYNRVRGRSGQPCGTPVSDPVKDNPLRDRCVIDYVAPRVNVDYYAQSNYFPLKLSQPNGDLKANLKEEFTFALNLVRTKRPEVTEANFMIGEFGFGRIRYGECLSAQYLKEVFDALEAPDAFKLSYALVWQVMDDSPIWSGDLLAGYGLYRTRGGKAELTLAGRMFQEQLLGRSLALPANCPQIRTPPPGWGVVDSRTGTSSFQLDPDSELAINAEDATTPFSTAGNTVRFLQSIKEFSLTRENARTFSETPMLINTSLPAGRLPGTVSVYMTDQRGYDSNAQLISLNCATCPAYAGCGIFSSANQLADFRPGSVLTIQGERFSASGNAVVIEQLDNNQNLVTHTLARDDAWTETTTQITARLPQGLITDRAGWLHVVDAQGRRSLQAPLGITRGCTDCKPSIRPCFGVVNHVSQQSNFNPGVQIAVRGANFSASGNQLIVEQSDKRFVLARDAAWTENTMQLTAVLPANILPGSARVYVIKADGRESSAREIQITSAVVSASAADYDAAALAPESIVAAFGTRLATSTAAAASAPLPTALAGTKVTIRDSVGVERLAPLFFVSAGQVNYQVPAGAALGRAVVTIASDDGAVSTGTTNITQIAPGCFSADARGKGLASAVVLRNRADGGQQYEAIGRYDAALRRWEPVPIDLGPEGEQVFLILFGTGWRGRSNLNAVTARIGGNEAQVIFAGAQGALTGLDQVNIRVPRALAGRGEANITLTIDGQNTNVVIATFK